jgi:hypothetical protein
MVGLLILNHLAPHNLMHQLILIFQQKLLELIDIVSASGFVHEWSPKREQGVTAHSFAATAWKMPEPLLARRLRP